MNDDDLDADIARLIRRRRNIETLGHSWFEGARSGKPITNDAEQRRRQNERQRRRRANMRANGIQRTDKKRPA